MSQMLSINEFADASPGTTHIVLAASTSQVLFINEIELTVLYLITGAGALAGQAVSGDVKLQTTGGGNISILTPFVIAPAAGIQGLIPGLTTAKSHRVFPSPLQVADGPVGLQLVTLNFSANLATLSYVCSISGFKVPYP